VITGRLEVGDVRVCLGAGSGFCGLGIKTSFSRDLKKNFKKIYGNERAKIRRNCETPRAVTYEVQFLRKEGV